MSTPPVVRDNWSKGIDNLADRRRQAENTVRDLVNLDPHADGTLKLRAGYERIYDGAAVRGLLALGRMLLIADGANLVTYNLDTSTASVIGQIDSAGTFAGAELNGQLFICTATETLRYDGAILRRWGVTHCGNQPLPTVGTGGGLVAGTYQIAATFLNAYGEEGGTTLPLQVTVEAGASLTFTLPTPPEGGTCRLYVSANSGENLYLQAEGTGAVTLTRLVDDTERLGTARLREPVSGGQVLAYNGQLLTAVGNVLWMTVPLRPHLRDAARGFIQLPAAIDLAVVVGQGAGAGVYLTADKTYFISDLEDQATLVEVLPYGGVPGTAVKLPDGRVTWMSQYGQVVADAGGQAQLLSAGTFVPDLASTGASGLIERDGNPMIVTTMRGAARDNPLSAKDYYRAEIVRNDP